MLKSLLKKFLNIFKEYPRAERLFVIFMMICSFSITAEAAITRSIANSFFIDRYSGIMFTYAWIALLPLNFAVVAFYNRFIPRFGCAKIMTFILSFTIVFNLLCIHFLKSIYVLPFFLYLWKDVFVIFMFHKLWSVINSTINVTRAKYIYGLFYGCGGMGAVFGSIVPSFFAVSYGTEKLLYATFPCYIVTYFSYTLALKVRTKLKERDDLSMSIENGNFLYGIQLIKNSKLLRFILLLVMGMQVSSTIMEYQFNLYLKDSFPILDLRTQFMGRLFSVVNLINVFLQFIGSFLLVRLIGLKGTHMFIPALLFMNTVLFFFFPSFGLICFGFGAIKSLDYSIFGIVKEMLYIPLNVEEKFKAKSIIDVFAYRSSKTVASLVILGLSFLFGTGISSMLTVVILCITTFWIYSVISMKGHFEEIELKNT